MRRLLISLTMASTVLVTKQHSQIAGLLCAATSWSRGCTNEHTWHWAGTSFCMSTQLHSLNVGTMHCQWDLQVMCAHCKFLRILDGMPADSCRCFEEDNHQVVLRTGQGAQGVQRYPGKWCNSAGNSQRNCICGIGQRKRSRCKYRNLYQKLMLAYRIRSKSRRKGDKSSRRSTHH